MSLRLKSGYASAQTFTQKWSQEIELPVFQAGKDDFRRIGVQAQT